MSAFALDTSGAVWIDPVQCPGIGHLWSDLTPFTQGYVRATLTELNARAGSVIKAAIPADLIDKVYAAEGWTKREGEGRTAQVKTLYALDRDNRAGVYTATRRAFAFSDLAPEALAVMTADCEAVRVVLGNRLGDGVSFWVSRQQGKQAAFPPLTLSLRDDGKIVLS